MIKILITIILLSYTIKFIRTMIKTRFKSIKPRQITAEVLIENARRQQVRPLKVEQAYNTTRYLFNQALKNKQIDRSRVLAIKDYLKCHTEKYEWKNKKFKNDCHMIYHLMKSHSLTKRDFMIINTLIGEM